MNPRNDLIDLVKKEIASETGLPLDDIANDATFFSLGLDSVSCVFVLDKLEKRLKVEKNLKEDLNPIYFWDYPTVETFSNYLSTLLPNE